MWKQKKNEGASRIYILSQMANVKGLKSMLYIFEPNIGIRVSIYVSRESGCHSLEPSYQPQKSIPGSRRGRLHSINVIMMITLPGTNEYMLIDM